ncbi:cytochrome C assembly family protein [Conservatibacter flavescens]|uniref:ABC transporter permease n=1 Tax=Conservatibacter flavescens TaxID=28161 RepID=A0A2M8S273_9PAST|nr:cytochrome c biogenesis protein CcsA [Conservatibacter flavescens]PJG85250.1 ABC transporter permease [Conservatibacter flavescens]
MTVAIVSISAYVLSVLLIIPILLKVQTGARTEKSNKTLFFLTALLAIVFHIISVNQVLSNLIDGHNFTLMEIGSLMSVIIATLATIAMLLNVNTLWFLLPIVYCFSVINLVVATFLPGHVVQHLSQNTGLLIHIGLALFAYAVCFIALLYAIQLTWIDHNLKHKKMTFSPMIPPLMTVERHFFRVLLSGEILLTLTLISGVIYLADFFAEQNIQKAIFSFVAWIIFGLLLIGHQQLHWRGKRVLIYTISGMILLTVAYFGSRAMLHV